MSSRSSSSCRACELKYNCKDNSYTDDVDERPVRDSSGVSEQRRDADARKRQKLAAIAFENFEPVSPPPRFI